MVSDADKTDARRFCGYPALGSGTDGNAGWRYFQAYGELEYRLGHLSPAEEAVLGRYMSTLRSLEQAVLDAANNLDTERAAMWSRNPTEVGDRTSLLDDWRRRLCAFLGVPPGQALARTTTVPLAV